MDVELRGAKALVAVDHPSVVRVYKPGIAEIQFGQGVREVLYVPMDYSTRGNSYQNPPFKDKHLSVQDIRSMIELLDGLQAIHKEEFIHQDIQPANILQFQEQIEGSERIVLRISDFGVSRVLPALGAIEESRFSKEFMPPERLNHKHTVEGDIYSMGATLFYMITGRLPIEPPSEGLTNANEASLAWQRVHQEQERPNAMKYSVFCPPRLALLIMRMMSVDPSDRPNLETCKRELQQIITTHDLQIFQRLELPKKLETELRTNEFPIRYMPSNFRGIFKPKIHEVWETKLFIIRIRMGHLVFSQYKVLLEYLVGHFSDSFRLYETWGTYDIHILMWSKHDEAEALSLKKRLEERLAGSRVEIRIASKIRDFHCDNTSLPKDPAPVYALAVQEGIKLPGLKHDEYLCKEFPDSVQQDNVRALTYVSLIEPITANFVRNAVTRNVRDELEELMKSNEASVGLPRFQLMSMIELEPPVPSIGGDDTSVLVVNFVASGHNQIADVTTALVGAGENAVRTETFVESGRVVIESDKILF